jgi:hypothetical protein
MSHLDDERAEMQQRLRQHGPPEGQEREGLERIAGHGSNGPQEPNADSMRRIAKAALAAREEPPTITDEMVERAVAVHTTRTGGHFEAVRDQTEEKLTADVRVILTAALSAAREEPQKPSLPEGELPTTLEVQVALPVEDWLRLEKIALFSYSPQDERILNAIKRAAESLPLRAAMAVRGFQRIVEEDAAAREEPDRYEVDDPSTGEPLAYPVAREDPGQEPER